MAKSDIIRKLENMFLGLMDKHGNPNWAIAEMEWKVFVVHGNELEQLSEDEQWEVRNYLGGLKKLFDGGK